MQLRCLPVRNVHNTTSTRSRKDPDHLSQRLKPLSKSESTLKGTTKGLVGFSRLELLDNGFSRWRWGGLETVAILH